MNKDMAGRLLYKAKRWERVIVDGIWGKGLGTTASAERIAKLRRIYDTNRARINRLAKLRDSL